MSRIESFWVGTACGHNPGEHRTRNLTLEDEYSNATLWRRSRPGAVKSTSDDERLVRYFGSITYCETSGNLQMLAAADATPEEIQALVSTGLVHRRKGATSEWDPSPCTRGERAIGVCRYIDDDFIEATVTALFSTDYTVTAAVDWDALEQVAA